MRRPCRAAARSTASFASFASVASVVCLVVVVASCTGDQAPSAGDAAAGGGTVAVATLPRVTPTVVTAAASTAPPTATAPPTTSAPAAVTTTGPTTTAAPSTTRPATATSTAPAPAPPCRLALIVEQTQTAYEGITPSDLACAEDWAAWIGRPEDELADGFFAVARYVGGSWELMNLGTAGVCADSGVPDELWTELGCFE